MIYDDLPRHSLEELKSMARYLEQLISGCNYEAMLPNYYSKLDAVRAAIKNRRAELKAGRR